MLGAAHLCARAAQRAGAGMVRAGSPGVDDDRGRPTEAVGVALPARSWGAAALAAADRCHAIVVGPGLGTGDDTRSGVRAMLSADLPVLVDGDGLSVLGEDAAPVLLGRSAPTVLTPHDGEYERLAGARPGADRIASTRALAERTGSVVLLKGSPTIVADPNGEVRVVASGDARLATAGTGDVLSGVIGALLAQGRPALEAAAAGAWLHGRAAHLGPQAGLVAGDLPALLVAALAEVCGR
jgi:hydroxyethylthiazole kinase-like uncharacterized protein yjeF